MIFQENLIGSIIGSIIATLGSILTWVIIDQLKKYFERKKDSENFNKLYKLFANQKLEIHMSINIENLFEEIGLKKIQKVLKLIYRTIYVDYLRTTYYIYENQLFKISLYCETGFNEIEIEEGDKIYDYKKENTNTLIKDRFLKFFEESCKNEKIKLKSEKKHNYQ